MLLHNKKIRKLERRVSDLGVVSYHYKARPKPTCLICGNIFQRVGPLQMTCLGDCQKTYRKSSYCRKLENRKAARAAKIKIDKMGFKCPECGSEKPPANYKSGTTIYCGKKCKQAVYNRSRKANIQWRLAKRLRGRLREMLDGCKKESALKLLGCSIEQFKEHLQSKFAKGMAWNNYGLWHIDHIQPCASFDLSDAYQRKVCFHWTNLRPLWATHNQSKGDKITVPQLSLPV